MHDLPSLSLSLSLSASLSCDQAGSLHSSHHSTDVQDPSPQRPHSGLLTERSVSRRNQVQRHVSSPLPGKTCSPPLPLSSLFSFSSLSLSLTLQAGYNAGNTLSRLLSIYFAIKGDKISKTETKFTSLLVRAASDYAVTNPTAAKHIQRVYDPDSDRTVYGSLQLPHVPGPGGHG